MESIIEGLTGKEQNQNEHLHIVFAPKCLQMLKLSTHAHAITSANFGVLSTCMLPFMAYQQNVLLGMWVGQLNFTSGLRFLVVHSAFLMYSF